MFEYMDDISELVYVADVETFELLYVNKSGREIFGIDAIAGQKCHKALQGSDTPCSFCSNLKLRKDENYTWEFTNHVTHHHYLLKDRLIDWCGRAARLEVAFDITEQQREGMRLQNALDAEGVVLQCARDLYRETNIADASNAMLARLGEYLDSVRAYIFEYRDDYVSNTYEWCSPGVSAEIDSLQKVEIEAITRWVEYFNRGECLIIEDLEALEGDGSLEYEILARQEIQSLAAAPLENNGVIVGFLGIDNPPVDKIRNIASLLQTLAYFYMTTVQRIQDNKKLLVLSFLDGLTGLYNRNRYMEDIDRFGPRSESLGVVFIDVNGLKKINDCCGHGAGDRTLKECSKTMMHIFKGADLYRIGGDEFVALFLDTTESSFHEKIHAFEQALTAKDSDGACLVSVGSQWSPVANDIKGMLAAADAQMYERKQRFHINRALMGKSSDDRYAGIIERGAKSVEACTLLNNVIPQEYNMLVGSLGVSVSKHLLDEHFTMVWANKYYYQLIGYSKKEYEQRFHNHIDLYFEDNEPSWNAVVKEIKAALEQGESGHEMYASMKHPNGTTFWAKIVVTFTEEVYNEYPIFYVIMTDVTDVMQMRVEQTVTYDNLPGFVAKYRITADVPELLYGNERFMAFFGNEHEKAMSESLTSSVILNSSAIKEHYKKLRAGESVDFEMQIQGIGGQEAHFRVLADCVDWIDDDPVCFLFYIDETEVVEQRRLVSKTGEQLQELVFVDSITGGRSRASFDIDVGRAIQAAVPNSYVLVSLDIQKFKVINDFFGIEKGNQTLKTMYDILDTRLKQGEYASRISADLFNLLMWNEGHEVLVERINEIARQVNEAVDFGPNRTYLLTFAAGVCEVDNPLVPMMQIQGRANIARKKNDGALHGQLCKCYYYASEDGARLAEEKELENRMQEALVRGEFIVYLQPKQNLEKGVTAGAEALVRWDHPEWGLISPDLFIPLFEKNGFIIDVDLAVFKKVCATLHAWIASGMVPLPISVNMSRVHLYDPQFIDRYEAIRREHDVPASLLEFELTETLAFENPKMLVEVIQCIHKYGYRCSMDDFGSGYSSLNVLTELEVDTLKLDKAFFDNKPSGDSRQTDVIEVVIGLAKRLNLETVAEGIEEEAQAVFLKQAGCDMIQGYLYSRPISIRAFEELVYGRKIS